jgi:hypothetical protein
MSDLPSVKEQLEGKLMPLDYVTGLGISGDKLAVYVSRPLSKDETAHVTKTIQAHAPDTLFTVHTTGEFGKQ